MTDPDFSPVTGNRIRPVNDCPCSTCAALRSGEPDTTPKEKPPMTDANPRLFTIHLVDRDPMPDAPPDPAPAIVEGMIDTVNREIERGLSAAKQIVDAAIARADEAEAALPDLRRQLTEALAAVEEWRLRATALDADRQAEHEAGCMWANDAATKSEELTSARAENERLRGELATHTKRLIAANHDRETMVTSLARANKRIEDLETREQHGADSAYAQRMTVDRLVRDLEVMTVERDAARAELRAELRAAREKHAESLCRLIDERDRAIAERDAARDSLAMSRATVDHVSAERDAAIQMRDAARSELREAREKHAESISRLIDERDEARKALAGYEWTEGNAAQVAALRARVAELEAAVAARNKRIFDLCDRIISIGALANCD